MSDLSKTKLVLKYTGLGLFLTLGLTAFLLWMGLLPGKTGNMVLVGGSFVIALGLVSRVRYLTRPEDFPFYETSEESSAKADSIPDSTESTADVLLNKVMVTFGVFFGGLVVLFFANVISFETFDSAVTIGAIPVLPVIAYHYWKSRKGDGAEGAT
jgi:hypothetical protein